MNRFINVAITLGVIVLSVAGCSTFSPRPDPSRFFGLSALPQTEKLQEGVSSDRLSIGIGPLKLPAYLDRQEIVVRSGQNRFDVSENDRWAEPLDENFARVLSQNLSALLATDRIVSYPWPSDRKPNYQVEIEVLRFEANAAGDVQLSARWAIIDGSDKKPLNLKESRLTRPVKEKSTDGSVAALSEAVADLSREIADAVRIVDGQRKP